MTSRNNKPIIEVKGLSKEYRIGMDRTYKTLSESVMTGLRHPVRTLQNLRSSKDSFWALKDVNFEVERGEVLGIIGRNGAGKSTLLKILSRITYPTEGEVVMRGRVGSLLEVGTGFHPELTGRENIYFNGAILGMKKREIEEKFDEIVKFSGVEKFLDTPVKRYSSGMNVRLAFSVAAHLDPEILLVDEVLAVGDAEFQKKCLGKMGEVASEGRTVLFVSHNMAAIQSLCQKAILIQRGQLYRTGDVNDIISYYLSDIPSETKSLRDRKDRQGNQRVVITQLGIYPSKGKFREVIYSGEDIVIEIQYENQTGETIKNIEICIGIYDTLGRAITFLENTPLERTLSAENCGGSYYCMVPKIALVPGDYIVNIHIKESGQLLDWIQQAVRFTVHEGDFFKTGKFTWTNLGGVFMEQSWSQRYTDR